MSSEAKKYRLGANNIHIKEDKAKKGANVTFFGPGFGDGDKILAIDRSSEKDRDLPENVCAIAYPPSYGIDNGPDEPATYQDMVKNGKAQLVFAISTSNDADELNKEPFYQHIKGQIDERCEKLIDMMLTACKDHPYFKKSKPNCDKARLLGTQCLNHPIVHSMNEKTEEMNPAHLKARARGWQKIDKATKAVVSQKSMMYGSSYDSVDQDGFHSAEDSKGDEEFGFFEPNCFVDAISKGEVGYLSLTCSSVWLHVEKNEITKITPSFNIAEIYVKKKDKQSDEPLRPKMNKTLKRKAENPAEDNECPPHKDDNDAESSNHYTHTKKIKEDQE